MTLQPDDPRLTAYALGELDAAEASAVEAELAENPAAAAAVDEIRGLAGELRVELSAEAAPGLTGQQREAVVAASAGETNAAKARADRRDRGLVFRFWVPLATAAAAVIVVGVILPMLGEGESARTVGNRNELALEGKSNRDVQARYRPSKRAEGGDYDSHLKPTGPGGAAGYKYGDKTGAAPGRPMGETSEDHYRLAFESRTEGVALGKDGKKADAWYAGDAVTGEKNRPDVTLGLHKTGAPGKGKLLLGGTRVRTVNGTTYTRDVVDSPVLPMPVVVPAAKPPPAAGARAPRQTEIASLTSEERRLRERAGRGRRGAVDKLARTDEVDRRVSPATAQPVATGHHTEQYAPVVHNPFVSVDKTPLSTFSIDVDTASYSNVRRFLSGNRLPPGGAVRIEEMVNYFSYDYAPPAKDQAPFAVHVDVAGCPWAADHRLVRIGLKGKVITEQERPATNLIFLLDRSGSMRPPNKLPLFKQAMKLLVERLDEGDSVGIVTYASGSGVALQPTTCDRKDVVNRVLDGLTADGSTNGAAGIRDAYRLARKGFIKGGVNRVILCTDGDFNVGTTSNSELVKLITKEAKSGVFLTVLGFGMGNIKDDRLEKLADKGNGHYAYIDGLPEARKVLVEGLTGTLITIAKDVKIQVELNPSKAVAYRLIGYENRLLAKEDFNDDTKDAGEIGAGHTVTALYEVVPVGVKNPASPVDKLKYQKDAPNLTKAGKKSGELLTVKLRYKLPDESVSKKLVVPVTDKGGHFNDASKDFKFAAAVASFGMILRDSPHAGTYSLDAAGELATSGLGEDPKGRRAEFVKLVKTAAALTKAAEKQEEFD